MNWIKELKHKTWIDWIKIIVALDIASAGVGLIVNLHFHVLANIFGFISRIFMGILYIMVATLIIKRVFPSVLRDDEKKSLKKISIDSDIEKGLKDGKKITKKVFQKMETASEKILHFIDRNIDLLEIFAKKRIKEIKREIHHLTKDDK